MGSAAITIDARTRAMSFTASAIIVTLVCVALLLMSRVIQLTEDSAIVNVVLEEAPRTSLPPARQAPQRTSGAVVTSPDAAPTPTPIPIERGLVQALACMDRFNRERPADCPTTPLSVDAGDQERTRRAYDPSPPRVRVALDPLPMGIDPPCNIGVHATTMGGDGVGGSACFRFGRDPPPPSRSAEEICLAGNVGPCRPPPFRSEDVVRLAHTD